MEFWKAFKILGITFGSIFWGAFSDWMSNLVQESPSDSVFVKNNSAKVKIKTQQTNWKSSPISILHSDKIKASLIYKLLTASFFELYAPNISCEISAEQSDSLFDFFPTLFFGAFLNIKLLFQETYWFPTSKKTQYLS